MTVSQFQALTLKDQTIDGFKSKVGHLITTDGERIDITVVRKGGEGYLDRYIVRIGNFGPGAKGRAGVVTKVRVGRWTVSACDAEGNTRGGYDTGGTLVEAVQTVALSYLESVRYAREQAEKATLVEAVDAAIAAENADPKGLPAEDIAALDVPFVAPAARSYTVGLPVTVTVHPDGTVTYEVDLSEADTITENGPPQAPVVEGDWTGEWRNLYSDEQMEADREAVTAALKADKVVPYNPCPRCGHGPSAAYGDVVPEGLDRLCNACKASA